MASRGSPAAASPRRVPTAARSVPRGVGDGGEAGRAGLDQQLLAHARERLGLPAGARPAEPLAEARDPAEEGVDAILGVVVGAADHAAQRRSRGRGLRVGGVGGDDGGEAARALVPGEQGAHARQRRRPPRPLHRRGGGAGADPQQDRAGVAAASEVAGQRHRVEAQLRDARSPGAPRPAAPSGPGARTTATGGGPPPRRRAPPAAHGCWRGRRRRSPRPPSRRPASPGLRRRARPAAPARPQHPAPPGRPSSRPRRLRHRAPRPRAGAAARGSGGRSRRGRGPRRRPPTPRGPRPARGGTGAPCPPPRTSGCRASAA